MLAACAALWLVEPAGAIVGDCNGDGRVRIPELIACVGIALGDAPISRCPAIDTNASGSVSIDELIGAVAAAIATPATPSPTPAFQVIDIGVAFGQPCGSTQVTFTLPAEPSATINSLRLEFCVDADAFDVEATTCSSFSSTVAFDSIEQRLECRLDAPVAPAGQVTVRAHGTGGASGDAFEPFDPIECRIPVYADTEGGDYPIRYLVVAQTSAGEVANAGEGTISIFGLPSTGRFQGQCCNADTQCEGGACRGGDATQGSACCENDCANGVCNATFYAGLCCLETGLPDICNPAPLPVAE
ncbi:MAG: hypothetical protein ACRERC_13205 [Candidatus Binatia bacterium]